MDWKTWCSLCANIDTKQVVSEKPIISAIYKHFNVVHQEEQLKICPECREFLDTFVLFEEKCRKVQLIFDQILSNDLINSKHLYDMRIDAGLDAGGIEIEAKNENMSSCENFEIPSFESHFKEEMNDDTLPYIPEHIESENEQIESAMTEQSAPDVDSSIRKLRTRAKTKTAATKSIKKKRKDRNSSKTPAKNKQIQCKTTPQNDDHDDSQPVDQLKPMKAKHRRINNIRKQAEFLNLKCKLCDAKVFENKRLYEEHMHVTHPDENRIFNCLKCSKSFGRWSSFRQHEQTHLPDDQRFNVSCDYCPKKFCNRWYAEVHVRAVHKDEKKIICDQCGKLLISMGALKEHLLTHSDERPFKCDFENCGKSFKSKAMLAKHQETHSTEKRICNICGLGLSTRATLLRHMVVHSNLKKFECKFCSQKFKRSKALKIHLILHTGMRPYSCPFCSYTCPNGANFRSHKKKYHPDELAKLEAAGKTLPTVVMPKLRELQSMKNGERGSDSH